MKKYLSINTNEKQTMKMNRVQDTGKLAEVENLRDESNLNFSMTVDVSFKICFIHKMITSKRAC